MRNKNICASRPQQFATTSFAFWCSSEITYWPFCRKYRLKVARRKNDLTSRSFFTDKIRRKIKSSVYEQQIFCLIMEQSESSTIFFFRKKWFTKHTYHQMNFTQKDTTICWNVSVQSSSFLRVITYQYCFFKISMFFSQIFSFIFCFIMSQ